MSEVIQNEIKTANRAMIKTVRDVAPEAEQLADREILDLVPPEGYKGFLTGWLMAKGVLEIDTVCDKETNINNH